MNTQPSLSPHPVSIPPMPHMADTLDELHCKVAFISASVWAFAALSKFDTMPGPEAWQGLGYFIHDVEASLSLLRKP